MDLSPIRMVTSLETLQAVQKGCPARPQLAALFNGLLARMIHDGSSQNRRVTLRDRRAEPGGPEAYWPSTLRGARRDE